MNSNCIGSKGNEYYFLFPVVGIKITDLHLNNSLDYIFSDATFVEMKDIAFLVNQNLLTDEIQSRQIRFTMQDNYMLLVKIVDNSNINIDWESMKIRAQERAEEIIAFIFFVFLYLSRLFQGIKMEKENYHYEPILEMVIANRKPVAYPEIYIRDHWPISTVKPPLTFTKQGLLDIFHKKQFICLFEAVIRPDNEPFKNLVTALVVLYLRANIPCGVTQCIGAVTALEILYRKKEVENDSYKNFESRLEKISSDLHKWYLEDVISEDNSILKKRHFIVHEGEKAELSESFRAIIAALGYIIYYSYYCKHFYQEYSESERTISYHNYLCDKINGGAKPPKLPKRLVDLRSMRYVEFYNLNSPDTNKDSFANCVVQYCNKSNCKIKDAYEEIQSLLYGQEKYFTSFQDFFTYWEENKEKIEANVKAMSKYLT